MLNTSLPSLQTITLLKLNKTKIMTQTVVGIFDNVSDAQRAIGQLVTEGISRDRIDLSGNNVSDNVTPSSSSHDEGFGESISKFFSNLFSDDEEEARKYSTVAQR